MTMHGSCGKREPLPSTANCGGSGGGGVVRSLVFGNRGRVWRLLSISNDGTGAPTLKDIGTSFDIATGGVLTIFISASPNGSSVWVRVVDDVLAVVFE